MNMDNNNHNDLMLIASLKTMLHNATNPNKYDYTHGYPPSTMQYAMFPKNSTPPAVELCAIYISTIIASKYTP